MFSSNCVLFFFFSRPARANPSFNSAMSGSSAMSSQSRPHLFFPLHIFFDAFSSQCPESESTQCVYSASFNSRFSFSGCFSFLPSRRKKMIQEIALLNHFANLFQIAPPFAICPFPPQCRTLNRTPAIFFFFFSFTHFSPISR